MSGVFAGFFIVWSVIGVGYAVGRSGVLGAHGQRVLSAVAFYVASPPLLFRTISEADVSHIFSAPLLVAAVSAWATMLVYIAVVGLAFRRDIATLVMGSQAASQVNSANLGIPIALYVLGDASQVAPVMLFQLALNTPLYLTVMDTLTDGRRPTLGSVLKNVVTNPMVVGSGLGVLFSAMGWKLPELLDQPVEIVAGAAVPTMLMAFGISLVGSRPLRSAQDRTDTVIASVAKVVVHPLLALGLALALGLDGSTRYAVVIMAALPTAQNLYVAAVRYRRAETVSRDTVLVTTVVSMAAMALAALALT